MIKPGMNVRQISPKRVSYEKLKIQSEVFLRNDVLNNLANALSQMLVVLNQERQIVFANRPFLDFLNKNKLESIIGKRPGEATNCIYSDLVKGGCGHSEFCKTCGAVNAIIESQVGKKSVQECNILNKGNEALELQITSTPYYFSGDEYTIFAITDISHEKRRLNLERLFFHDVLNTAGGISDLSNILKEVKNPTEMAEIATIIKRAADNMVYEISSQRQLLAAERGELKINFAETDTISILNNLKNTYERQEIACDKSIIVDKNSENHIVNTDKAILRRVLGNMLKNALEASYANSEINLSCKKINNKIQYSVHNNSYIERKLQLQIFKRSFSTKGSGRGLGSYSMKLLGEKYLKGKVWFESNIEAGTTFYIEL